MRKVRGVASGQVDGRWPLNDVVISRFPTGKTFYYDGATGNATPDDAVELSIHSRSTLVSNPVGCHHSFLRLTVFKKRLLAAGGSCMHKGVEAGS